MRLFLPVHFFRPILTLLFLAAIVFQAAGQEEAPTRRRGSRIIDDTTKQVYGPKTSRYYYEQDFFYNRPVYTVIDTAIRNFHRWTYVQQNHYFYQDLGNIGTAMRSIYYMPPTLIGATSGFTAYDVYWDAEKIKYFDTKSPYSNMRVILGGKGRSVTRVTYSRNIKPHWNIGFNFRSLLIDKQIQRAAKGDRNTIATYYDVYTTYQTKDSTYRLFLNFRRGKHDVYENGGILQRDDFVYKDYFAGDAQPNLHAAKSEDLRMNLHLYHQYRIGSGLQLYHVFDRYRQGNNFTDILASEPEEYYGKYVVKSLVNDSTNDYTKFKALRNEVGIKGNLLKLFYNGYYALRNVTYTNSHLSGDSIKVSGTAAESYIGGRMLLALDSIGELGGWVEVQQNGNYRVEGTLKSRWFEASLKQMQYSPSYFMQSYIGAYNEWYNDFNSTNMTQINGYIHYRSPIFSLSPGLTFTTLSRYVYLKERLDVTEQNAVPVQSSGNQVIASPEVKVSLVLAKHIHFDAQFVYTRMLKNDDDAIQLPPLFINSQLSYENIFFNGNLDMHAGADFHYQSDYYANNYWVPTQQFYTQTTFTSPSFPLIDLFFSARIKRGRIFLKYNNVMQAFTKEGYMATPQYPGQRPILDFGFDWSFYD